MIKSEVKAVKIVPILW